jgi:hypothetical protein
MARTMTLTDRGQRLALGVAVMMLVPACELVASISVAPSDSGVDARLDSTTHDGGVALESGSDAVPEGDAPFATCGANLFCQVSGWADASTVSHGSLSVNAPGSEEPLVAQIEGDAACNGELSLASALAETPVRSLTVHCGHIDVTFTLTVALAPPHTCVPSGKDHDPEAFLLEIDGKSVVAVKFNSSGVGLATFDDAGGAPLYVVGGSEPHQIALHVSLDAQGNGGANLDVASTEGMDAGTLFASFHVTSSKGADSLQSLVGVKSFTATPWQVKISDLLENDALCDSGL